MKQALLDLMVAMMPFMMPIVWLGYASVACGVLLLVAALAVPRLAHAKAGALLAGRLAAAVGIFFIACQIMGNLLGAQPAINFGDSTKFEFNLVPFWQIGGAFLASGIVIALLAMRGAARPA